MAFEPLFSAGHTACAGCPMPTIIRQVLEAAGPDVIVVNATSCSEIISSAYPRSAWRVPYVHSLFENPPAVASGVVRALRAQGNGHTTVLVVAGDGSTYDIGFGALSGMLERDEDVLYVCYDNEAYMNCLSTDSLIATKEGYRRITEIKPGDEVYAFDRKTHKLVLKACSGVFDNGVQDVYELETRHHSIKATSNHPFLVLQRNQRGRQNNFVWKTLAEVREGDEVVALKRIQGGNPQRFGFAETKVGDYKVTHVSDVHPPQQTTPELMKYLGLYVGDGWVRPEKGRGEVGFALPESCEGRRELLDIHGKLFGNSINASDKVYVYVNSANLSRFIDSLGFGRGAKNKTIPAWVYALPLDQRESFIEGMMLSDGYAIGNSNRYVSASFELLRRMRLLLQTMGYRVGKIHRQEKKEGDLCAGRRLLKDSSYGYVCFSKPRGPNFAKYPSQSRYRNFLADNEFFETSEVRAIRLVGKEPTLDLRVEGEHNFIADGIVVHNTGVQRSGATPYGARTTTSPVGKVHHGKELSKKPIVEIVAAHGVPYAASASIGYPQDLAAKVKKAMSIRGSRFIDVFSPCIPGWGISSDSAIRYAKLAVETGLWKLTECEHGAFRLTMKPSPRKPVKEYLAGQARFRHLKDEDVAKIQAMADEEWKKLE